LLYHPDAVFTEYLISGLTHGFDTGLQHLPTLSHECKNLLSASQNPEDTTNLLVSELSNGYVIGPFDKIPFLHYRISPLGIAESKYSRKKRLIVDLSAPHDDSAHPSLNDLIDKDDFSLSYVSIDNAISVIQKLGKGSWLCKTDIKDAFKLLPIKESLWPFYGVKWKDKYYFYTRLVFGSRSSPKIFDFLSLAICWILHNNYHVEHILHLLDDFLTIDSPDSVPERTMALLMLVFKKLGIPLADHKTVGPTHCLEFLGVILDAEKMEARLPADKVARIASILQSFYTKKTCTKRVVEPFRSPELCLSSNLSRASFCFLFDWFVNNCERVTSSCQIISRM